MDKSLDEKPMALVRNVWKSYKSSHYVLKDLSMVIPKGKIYSILGSSGVGKTTLLKCLTKCTPIDAGYISVDITSRLQIGYMPQELGLYMDLTVMETFYVFGKVLLLSKKEIEEKMIALIGLLELPDKNSKVASLSGGEQRRVSLAVAMFKNPDLLILDEPTVSLDSLLKNSIWNYLERISRVEGKTIVLTTHYIEEANNSDVVGFVNYGRMLKEGKPSEVIASTGCNSLEEVYYKLCHHEVKSIGNLKTPEVAYINNGKISKEGHNSKLEASTNYNNLEEAIDKLCHKSEAGKIVPEIPQTILLGRNKDYNYRGYSNARMLAMFLKSLFYVRRNYPVSLLFLFTPCILTMLTNEICGRPKQLPVGFVNLESDCAISTANLSCSTLLSCRYLNKLKQYDINMVTFNDIAEALDAASHNQIWGVVKFSSNFSDSAFERMSQYYTYPFVKIRDEDEAAVWLDMSSYPISYMLRRTLYDSFLELIEDWYGDCGWKIKAAHPFIRIQKPIYGKLEESISNSYSPAMTVMMVFSGSCSLVLILILTEKESGTFERCKVLGMTLWELIMSEFLFCYLIMLPATTCQLLILYFYSGPSNAPVFLAVVLINLMALSGILLGIVIALLTTNFSVAFLVTITLMNTFYYLVGIMWPLEGSHWFTRYLNSILPSTISVGTMVDMANKGSTITDYRVYIGFIHTVLWIIIFVISIIFLIQRHNKR